MGNVLASSPVAGPTLVPPPPSLSPQMDKELDLKPKENESRNPGTMEDIHRKCKELMPTSFEGCRLIVNKGLSNHFQISHTINMSSTTPSGYRFGATYVGTKHTAPGEAYPVLLGDIDPNGNLNANMLHQFNSRIKTKLVAQIQDRRCAATQMTADYKGNEYTASMTLGNIDMVNSSGIAVMHYLHNIAPKMDLGAELAYQYGPQVPGGSVSVISLAGRYTAPQYIISGTLSNGGTHLCYYHKTNDSIQVGVEVETNLRMGESSATFGYQVDLPKANLVFRGSVDSNLQVSGVLEKKLQPFPFTFLLSGHIAHSRNTTYKFGCGLLIG